MFENIFSLDESVVVSLLFAHDVIFWALMGIIYVLYSRHVEA